MTRHRFGSLRITLATSAALLASGCDRGPGTRICADPQGRRIDDSFCGTRGGGGGSHYLYLGRSASVPAIGEAASGSLSPSSGARYSAAPASGVERGGFGMSAHGGGEGGHGGGGE